MMAKLVPVSEGDLGKAVEWSVQNAVMNALMVIDEENTKTK
jgi:hypothetical protein